MSSTGLASKKKKKAGGEAHVAAAHSASGSRNIEDRTSPVSTKTGSNSHASSSLQARRVTHKVKSGETLYGIARRYNTTVAALERQNGHTAARLKPGDVLVIPAANP